MDTIGFGYLDETCHQRPADPLSVSQRVDIDRVFNSEPVTFLRPEWTVTGKPGHVAFVIDSDQNGKPLLLPRLKPG